VIAFCLPPLICLRKLGFAKETTVEDLPSTNMEAPLPACRGGLDYAPGRGLIWLHRAPFLLVGEGVLDEPKPSPAFADRGPTFWRLQIVDLRLWVASNLSPQRVRKPLQSRALRLYAVTGVVGRAFAVNSGHHVPLSLAGDALQARAAVAVRTCALGFDIRPHGDAAAQDAQRCLYE